MESIYLRALEISDLERIYNWHNNINLYGNLVGAFHYVSHASVEEWVLKKQVYSSQEINLAICLIDSSQHIGNIYLRDIDWISRHAELHVFIGDPDQRSKGYGQAALRLVMDYAFQSLDLHRLYLFVLEGNLAAIKIYEKCGFLIEGKMSKHAFKNGEYKDVLIMGKCKSARL